MISADRRYATFARRVRGLILDSLVREAKQMKMAGSCVRVILGLWVAGCSTGPTAPTLLGTWGGGGMGLVATSEQVVISMVCQTSATVDGPIELDAAGEFELTGTLETGYSSVDMHVTGRVRGDHLNIVLTLPLPEPPDYIQEFTLRRGWPPNYGDPICPG